MVTACVVGSSSSTTEDVRNHQSKSKSSIRSRMRRRTEERHLCQQEGNEEERLTRRRCPEDLKDCRGAADEGVEDREVDDSSGDKGANEQHHDLEDEVEVDGVERDPGDGDRAAPAAHQAQERGRDEEHEGQDQRRDDLQDDVSDCGVVGEGAQERVVEEEVLGENTLQGTRLHHNSDLCTFTSSSSSLCDRQRVEDSEQTNTRRGKREPEERRPG